MKANTVTTRFRQSRTLITPVCLVLSLMMTACETVGPTALQAGRNDYNAAIQQTSNEELLLNIVRLRYNDTPTVLAVSNITSRTEFEAELNAQLRHRDQNGPRNNFWEKTVSGGLSYAEKPSINYAPVEGDKFVRQMLSPLDLETIFLLRFSGWEMSNILRTFARAMNDVPNAPTGGDSTPNGVPQYKDFLEGMRAMSELESEGAIIYALAGRRQKGSQGELVLKILPRARELSAFTTFTRVFGLDPGASQYRIKIGWQPEGKTDLVVETRPILSSMFFLSRNIAIPDELRARKVAYFNLDKDNKPFDWNQVLGDLVKIRSSSVRPTRAATAAYYRDYWYYIDDNDYRSKETLSMLAVVISLKAGGGRGPAPVLTIPVE